MADDYYSSFNNTAYNSIESDVCHLVYVGRVEMLRESEVSAYSTWELADIGPMYYRVYRVCTGLKST